MIDTRAVAVGLVATLAVVIGGQLIFILAAAEIGNARDSYGFFSSYKQELWFVSGMLTHCLTLFVGGAITAAIARDRAAITAAIVGGAASVLSLAISVGEDEFQPMSILLILLGIGCAALGARWHERRSLPPVACGQEA